jgi:hypothetical protein
VQWRTCRQVRRVQNTQGVRGACHACYALSTGCKARDSGAGRGVWGQRTDAYVADGVRIKHRCTYLVHVNSGLGGPRLGPFRRRKARGGTCSNQRVQGRGSSAAGARGPRSAVRSRDRSMHKAQGACEMGGLEQGMHAWSACMARKAWREVRSTCAGRAERRP